MALKRYLWYTDLILSTLDAYLGDLQCDKFNPIELPPCSALIKSQDHLQESVPGFRYNLGFSGGYFHHSEIPEELAGDDAIMRNKDKFWDELYKNRSSGKTDSQ